MKILITGANGFIGKSINNFLIEKNKFDLISLGRDKLDLLNFENVYETLNKETPDVVIHCAVKGGTRFDNDTEDTFNQNVLMYNNLKSLKEKFGCLINIGSGAEFDRSQNIKRANESLLFKRFPNDFYGKAKNKIARDVVSTNNFYNLRIFGCFGELENENRLLKIAFSKNNSGKEIIVSNNRQMDYIHVNDLANTIMYYINNFDNKDLPKDINVVYKDKFLISNLIEEFIPKNEKQSQIIVASNCNEDYSGDESTIYNSGIASFFSFSMKKSLVEYYNKLKLNGEKIE